jgi:hypothetical protein
MGKVSENEEMWVDVTAALRRGVQKLNLGEMLCAPGFELEQAISAAEVGDPRMDPPVKAEKNADALVEQGEMPLQLSHEQQAALLDALTVRLVQWWTGHPLHLTLYTSLHLAAIDKVPKERAVLRAIVDLVQALVDLTRHICHASGVIAVRSGREHVCPADEVSRTRTFRWQLRCWTIKRQSEQCPHRYQH